MTFDGFPGPGAPPEFLDLRRLQPGCCHVANGHYWQPRRLEHEVGPRSEAD